GYQAQVRQYQRALRIGMPRSEALQYLASGQSFYSQSHREISVDLGREPARSAAQHHPCQSAHSTFPRCDCELAKAVRRRLTRNAVRVPVVDWRHLRGKLWSETRTESGAIQDAV